MAISTSTFLLTLYVCCETIRANYAYYAFHTFPQISAILVTLLAEIFKLSIAVLFLIKSNDGLSLSAVLKFVNSTSKGQVDFRRTLKYAMPAALYLINNLIYYTVLPLTTPSLLQVCVLAKLPTTGILHHYMIKPQRNVHAWISLGFLCIGLAIFNIPSKPRLSGNEQVAAWWLAPAAGFVIACLSALASISSETATKEGDFWVSQTYLYLWGIFFGAIAYPLAPSSKFQTDRVQVSTTFGVSIAISALVVITAGTGLVVAVVLRFRDNILKVIGTAASLITIAGSQFLLLPDLSASTFTSWKVCGGGIVTTATWCYNHYSQEPWEEPSPEFLIVPPEDIDSEIASLATRSSSEDEKEKVELEVREEQVANSVFRPDATKIFVCVILTAFATYEVVLRQSV